MCMARWESQAGNFLVNESFTQSAVELAISDALRPVGDARITFSLSWSPLDGAIRFAVRECCFSGRQSVREATGAAIGAALCDALASLGVRSANGPAFVCGLTFRSNGIVHFGTQMTGECPSPPASPPQP
eukprot:1221994-Pleurochrysis_carterae.AAC.1